MAQKRIRALDLYTQLDSGDEGYLAASTIRIAVDAVGFAGEPKYIVYEDLLASTHIESDRVTGLADRSVAITFGTAFTSVPVTVVLKVYRIGITSPGKYRFNEVLWYHATATPVTTTGFELVIEAAESLTGIILEYYFTQP